MEQPNSVQRLEGITVNIRPTMQGSPVSSNNTTIAISIMSTFSYSSICSVDHQIYFLFLVYIRKTIHNLILLDFSFLDLTTYIY